MKQVQPCSARRSARSAGFTLVEIAIVLLIVGLMIGGLMAPLSSQLEQRRVSETQRAMELAREALMGYALRNSHLPCPAISAQDGREDRNGTICNKRYGYVPWITLGVGRLDGWGRVIQYSVTPAFANNSIFFSMQTARDITIATRDANGEVVQVSEINDIPAVLISFGRNGYGATSDQNTLVADAGNGNADEKTNLLPGGTAFINRVGSTDAQAPGGEFDDIVLWISPNILINRMVAAQRLP